MFSDPVMVPPSTHHNMALLLRFQIQLIPLVLRRPGIPVSAGSTLTPVLRAPKRFLSNKLKILAAAASEKARISCNKPMPLPYSLRTGLAALQMRHGSYTLLSYFCRFSKLPFLTLHFGAAGFAPQSGYPRFAGCRYQRSASRSLWTTRHRADGSGFTEQLQENKEAKPCFFFD
ncbi:hypothetical protein SAMN02745218_00630 [Desulfofundulus australicus DSM 11792]|uniref:Uncharacterized protein n=1 Tax=Desulfofundulus australicus DSM 11792 TaxID=1121425 RepID=A0A1M4V375_9FIRM|nr:hypothetical protein SAMN02745218_00630 [Desulfofundulus australicus DSM 11792]